MKNIYNDKWGLAYGTPLWGGGLVGINFLISGLFLLNIQIILFGLCATVMILRKDVLYFAKSDRLFLVTLMLQAVFGSASIWGAITYNFYQLFFLSVAITLIWTSFFFFYYLKKLDWNE
ncbi:hypothetical protein ACJ3XJ_01060 [Marinomonas sp. RS-M-Aa-14]|uniref:hypothetical protein n=1 Tax=Marinomonas sp. RS-M-Aa-14 TaxID=3241169 RepID=UPI00390C5452